jgi:hypothetical protein
VLSTLGNIAKFSSFHARKGLLQRTFHENGYSRALNPPQQQVQTPRENPVSLVFLLFAQNTFSNISKMLSKHKIKTADITPSKVSSFCHPVKDELGLKTLGIYSTPCKCGKLCIGQTNHSIITRVNMSYPIVSTREVSYGRTQQSHGTLYPAQ